MDHVARILRQPGGLRALELGNKAWTYGELTSLSLKIVSKLDGAPVGPMGLVGVLANRSLTGYAGVLATQFGALGYAPLNPEYPLARTRAMAEEARLATFIVGQEGLDPLAEILAGVEGSFLVLGPEIETFGDLVRRCPSGRFVSRDDFEEQAPVVKPADENSIAYLLFTSGTTGGPKGVPVRRRNLQAYLDHVAKSYPLNSADRCSQTFDLTFDLSAHDMFLTWASGACLCPLSKSDLLNPARFLRDRALTVWFSVPSLAAIMSRTQTLRPGLFSSLRLSFFCGEALPISIVAKWAAAAPNSRIINLYGPTEATIAIAAYEICQESLSVRHRHGLVPLGWIFETQGRALVDEDKTLIEGEGAGELYLSGTQVSDGYLNNHERTSEQFVQLDGSGDRTWYRTGDRVFRAEDGCLFFEGRIDNQVKISGHRVELQEIEGVLREVTNVDVAVAVAWPPPPAAAEAVIAFVSSLPDRAQQQELRQRCGDLLPSYMVPQRIIELDSFPLNASGKVDRHALASLI